MDYNAAVNSDHFRGFLPSTLQFVSASCERIDGWFVVECRFKPISRAELEPHFLTFDGVVSAGEVYKRRDFNRLFAFAD